MISLSEFSSSCSGPTLDGDINKIITKVDSLVVCDETETGNGASKLHRFLEVLEIDEEEFPVTWHM